MMASPPRKTFGIDRLHDVRLLMATGVGASLYDPEGHEMHHHDIEPGRGWPRVKLSSDESSFYLHNCIDGTIEKRELASGELLAIHNIGHRPALCGIHLCPPICTKENV